MFFTAKDVIAQALDGTIKPGPMTYGEMADAVLAKLKAAGLKIVADEPEVPPDTKMRDMVRTVVREELTASMRNGYGYVNGFDAPAYSRGKI